MADLLALAVYSFILNKVELLWNEHWWLVYHGCFELVFESLGPTVLTVGAGMGFFSRLSFLSSISLSLGD